MKDVFESGRVSENVTTSVEEEDVFDDFADEVARRFVDRLDRCVAELSDEDLLSESPDVLAQRVVRRACGAEAAFLAGGDGGDDDDDAWQAALDDEYDELCERLSELEVRMDEFCEECREAARDRWGQYVCEPDGGDVELCPYADEYSRLEDERDEVTARMAELETRA